MKVSESVVFEWHGRLAYHDEQQWLDIIREELSECARDAERLGCEFSYTREWQRGPHLSVRVRGNSMSAIKAKSEIDIRLVDLLRRSPSVQTLTLDSMGALFQQRADKAGTPLDSNWLANNSISWDPPTRVSPPDDIPALIRDFHFRATGPALRLLVEAGVGHQLGVAACDLMAATASAFGRNGLAIASTSFLSHAEAYLCLEAPPQTRHQWHKAAISVAPALRDRLFAIESGDLIPWYVSEWISAVEPVIQVSREMHRSGNLQLPTIENGFSPELVSRSPFHHDITQTTAWAETLNSEWFQLYRVGLNLLYLQLSRMGFPPVSRYKFCYLVAHAVSSPRFVPNQEEAIR
jgi:hypothetical protein